MRKFFILLIRIYIVQHSAWRPALLRAVKSHKLDEAASLLHSIQAGDASFKSYFL
jgi:hypothetical protein